MTTELDTKLAEFRETDDGKKMRLLSEWMEGIRPAKPDFTQTDFENQLITV